MPRLHGKNARVGSGGAVGNPLAAEGDGRAKQFRLRRKVKRRCIFRCHGLLQNHRRKLLPRTWRLTLAEVSNTNVLCTWYTGHVHPPV